MSRQVLILDSSQLSQWLECSQKWSYTYEECITKNNTLDDPIVAGTLMHKFLEIYYSYWGRGYSRDEAILAACRFDPDAADETDKHQYPLGKEIRAQVLNRFSEYTTVYQNDFEVATRPKLVIQMRKETGLPYDSFVPEPLIEQGFSYELLNTSEYLFVLEGRIDFIGSTHGNPLWMDHKLQFRQRQLYKKSIQFRNYSLALGYNLGVINYVRMAKGITKDTFVREPISFSSIENRLWKEELIEIYREIGRSKVKKNRDACSGKFGYSCQYIDICEEWNSETAEAIKKQKYVQVQKWTPW